MVNSGTAAYPTRYSIMGCSVGQIQEAGGVNIQTARFSGIVFAELTEFQAERLREAGCVVSKVAKIKPDVSAPPEVSPPTPVEAVPTYRPSELVELGGYEEIRAVLDPPLYGEGVKVAVIGTGIRETHEMLGGRVVHSRNFTTETMADGFNHDTGVASIILAVAPQCGILNFKVIGNSGEGTEEAVVMAIEECIELHDSGSEFAPSVINLSLGGLDTGNVNDPMRVACRTATEIGIWVVAAAGNSGPGNYTVMSPACERYVFAVGSVKYVSGKDTFIISDYSSRGPTPEGFMKPDTVIFGEDIIMASSESDTATVYKSGTSFAAPFTSGVAVLYLEGVMRQAATLVEIGDLPAAQLYYVPPSEIIDYYFPRICIKPAGVPAPKDSAYGYGLLYGPLVANAIRAVPVTDISALLAALLPMVMIAPMMSMVMKSVPHDNAGRSKVAQESR